MKKPFQLFAIGFGVLLLLSCGASKPAIDSKTQRLTTAGSVIGFMGEHNTAVWKGIPYAAPPIGDLRWRAPQSVASWSDTLEAIEFGPSCIQPPNPIAGKNAPEHEHVVGSEDCLTLNVFAPVSALEEGSNLPVMFWIHGGANMVGSAQDYDASRLANSQNVVVVSINYRLGLLGWFRHAALRPAGASKADLSGNFGTLDIIAALKWVQSNIAAFGGNPASVTVFGESAGGRNTWSMVQSPLAKNLFHKAIVQSGSLKIMDPVKSESISDGAVDYPGYQNNSAELVAKWVPAQYPPSASTLAAALRALSADELYAQVTPHPQGLYEQPRLFLDGHVFTQPALELFKDPAQYNSVPIITGSNRDEDKLFLMFNEQWVNFRLGFLPKVKDTQRYNKAAALGADTWRYYSVDKPAEVITQHGGAPVYTYRFDFDDMSDAIIDLPLLLGAGHAMEIPFVFGSHVEVPWRWMFSNSEQRAKLSDSMMSYWGEFARTGNPGNGGFSRQVSWKAWQPDGEHIMLFDTENDGGVRMVNAPMRIDDIKHRLINDDAFSRQERCDAYPMILLNGYMVADSYDSNEHQQLCAQ